MARTSSNLVRTILREGTEGGDYDDVNCPSLTPYIDSANVFISRVVICATRKGITLSSTEQEILERWVAAHMYAMSDQPYTEKQTQRAKGVFQGRTGMYFEATKYGQNAVSLDPSGCVAALGSKAGRPSVRWLGKPKSDQIEYTDRD